MNPVQQKLIAYIKAHPELTYWQIAEMVGCHTNTISSLARKAGIRRMRPRLSEADLEKLEQ